LTAPSEVSWVMRDQKFNEMRHCHYSIDVMVKKQEESMKYIESIGNTPCLFIDGIYVKLECSNPGGSVKDRIGKFLIQEAEKQGKLRPGNTLVETTSGNTGIALSLAARELGYRVIIYMPEHMSVERRRMIQQLGAEIRLTPQSEGFEGAVARRDAYRGIPGYYVPDQFSNPDNTRCHRLSTGAELRQQLQSLGCKQADWLVAGVGTGGTLMGIGQALPGVQLAAVEPDECAVMSGDRAGDHGIMGIGDGFIPNIVNMKTVRRVIRISTADALAEAERIRKEYGFCVGISAGANTLAAFHLRDEGAVVATLWPDCADRYVSIGLEDPASKDVQCPFRTACAARSRTMLGEYGNSVEMESEIPLQIHSLPTTPDMMSPQAPDKPLEPSSGITRS
jgi:cysteine synthase A